MAYTLGNKCAKIFVNGQFYINLSSKTWSHVFFGTQCIVYHTVPIKQIYAQFAAQMSSSQTEKPATKLKLT